MANQLYALGKKGLLEGIFALNSGTNPMTVALTDEAVRVPVPATDQYFSTINAGANTVGTPVAVTTPSTSGGGVHGTYDADDTPFPGLAGATVESINIYRNVSSNPATSPLLVYLNAGTNIPFLPNSGTVTIQWSNAPQGIFAI